VTAAGARAGAGAGSGPEGSAAGPGASADKAARAGVGAGRGSGQGEGSGPGVLFDAAALHRRLDASAQRCYPAAALRFRLKGEVPLNFCLDGAGALSSVRLQGSTGSAILDRAAQSCVVQGAVPLPAASGCYDVQIRFARAE